MNRAGSAWRLLFVYALFPWLTTYRIGGEEPEDADGEQQKPKLDLTHFRTLRSDFSGVQKNEKNNM